MFYLLSVLSLFLSGVNPASAEPKVRLQVEVQNVASKKGSVLLALFKPGDEFPEGSPLEGKKTAASASTVTFTFLVTPGDYAIALFHDENGNGKMDKNMLGIPKEPYGFSNDFRPRISAPKFKDCQFSVGESGKALRISLAKF